MKPEQARPLLKSRYHAAIAVSIVTFLIFIPALWNKFVIWDDTYYVIENFFIHSLDAKFFVWAFTHFHAANWHPLTWISHAVDYALWGLNPFGHHLTNNILHALNSMLAVLVAVALLNVVRRGQTGTRSPSLFLTEGAVLSAGAVAGLLFGLHPLHVESVAWVSERKDLLYSLFFLLGILTYIRYGSMIAEHIGCGKRFFHRYYLYALGFFVLSLSSKPMAVTFPLVIMVLDWYPLQRVRSFKTFRSAFVEKLPFFGLALISAAAAFAAQSSAGAVMSSRTAPLSARALIACNAVVTYLWKMLLPFDLSPFYPYPHEVSLFLPGYFLPVVTFAVLTAASLVVSKSLKLWLAVWAYYLLTLLPVIGIIQVGLQSRADRYTYLPSLGPFLILGLAVPWAYAKVKGFVKGGKTAILAVAAPCILLLAGMSYLTVRQIGVWKNTFTLWDSVIEMEPGKVFFAYMNRGMAYDAEGRYNLAIKDYDMAAAINSSDVKVYINRAITYSKAGDFDRAIEDCNRALSINPDVAQAYNNRGIAYSMKGLLDEAIEDYTKALARNPQDIKAFVNRGNALRRKGLPDMAIQDYSRALAIDPGYAYAYVGRALAHLDAGSASDAASDLRRGCSLGNEEACGMLKN